MEESVMTLFSEFGVIATLFIAMVGGMILFFVKMAKYFPKMIDKHFDSLAKMTEGDTIARRKSQDEFAKSLGDITRENKIVTSGLLKQFEKQGADHEELLVSLKEATKVLIKLDRTQDTIHQEIKDSKK